MRVNKTLLHHSRTLHIYLTLLALAAMLFFAITGFTAHHEDWFNATEPQKKEPIAATIPADLLKSGSDLALIDYIRKTHHIRGSGIAYNESPEEISITYKRPGGEWTALITKPAGQLTLSESTWNTWAVVNDLHRGRNATGAAWGWVIDLSALLIVLACITGFILWLALPKRRKRGILYMLLGTAALFAVYYLLLPAADEVQSAPRPTSEKREPSDLSRDAAQPAPASEK